MLVLRKLWLPSKLLVWWCCCCLFCGWDEGCFCDFDIRDLGSSGHRTAFAVQGDDPQNHCSWCLFDFVACDLYLFIYLFFFFIVFVSCFSTPRLPLKLKNAVGSAVASFIRVADLTPELSVAARALVQECYRDIDPTQLFDYHTHLFGTGGGCCESGCLIPKEEDRDLKLATVSTVFMKCAGVRSKETGDDDFGRYRKDRDRDREKRKVFKECLITVEMLKRLVHGKHVLLAFDRHFNEDGSLNEAKTKLHTPDQWYLFYFQIFSFLKNVLGFGLFLKSTQMCSCQAALFIRIGWMLCKPSRRRAKREFDSLSGCQIQWESTRSTLNASRFTKR